MLGKKLSLKIPGTTSTSPQSLPPEIFRASGRSKNVLGSLSIVSPATSPKSLQRSHQSLSRKPSSPMQEGAGREEHATPAGAAFSAANTRATSPALHAEAGVEDSALRCSDELWQTCIKMFPCLEQGQQRKTSRMESLMIADNELIDALVQGFLPLVKFQVRSPPCALRYAPVGFRCAACRLPLRCGVVLSAPVDSSSL